MAVDVDKLSRALERFAKQQAVQFERLTARRSQLLELGALTVTARHYELHGYNVVPQNVREHEFRVKLSTKGHPWNFSWFDAERDGKRLEIHANLPMQDALATDGARYVVDVAVIRSGTLPLTRPDRAHWTAMRNKDVMTFVEAKALVIYPMLLAQFIGIVHELKPRFLTDERPRGFAAANHFNPTLVSLGYLHGTCRNIVAGYTARRCHIGVVPAFDEKIARLGGGRDESPLDPRPLRGAV